MFSKKSRVHYSKESNFLFIQQFFYFLIQYATDERFVVVAAETFFQVEETNHSYKLRHCLNFRFLRIFFRLGEDWVTTLSQKYQQSI